MLLGLGQSCANLVRVKTIFSGQSNIVRVGAILFGSGQSCALQRAFLWNDFPCGFSVFLLKTGSSVVDWSILHCLELQGLNTAHTVQRGVVARKRVVTISHISCGVVILCCIMQSFTHCSKLSSVKSMRSTHYTEHERIPHST